jgi:hypothetical protein
MRDGRLSRRSGPRWPGERLLPGVKGRMTAESHILFRPDLCKHYRSHPNQELDE